MQLEKTNGAELVNELTELIEASKKQITAQINSSLTILFWRVGNSINKFILQNERADYGKQIVVTVSRQLTERYGRNYEEKNLRRMIQFAKSYSNYEKITLLSKHLSWSHFLALIPMKNDEAKDFYSKLVYDNRLGVRGLRNQINRKVFERTKNSDLGLIESDKIGKGIFKDPYFLDFLELKEGYLENDLEAAILKELELFILELGNGFSFIERQKRMIIDGEDFYLDLLFYHRKLKRLVAIELKIEKFKPKHKGQMELYLKWLDRYERQEGEKTPIGLILCALASKEQIELLEMHKDGIMVAEYWTDLPPKEILEAKLHEAMSIARERISRRKLE